MPYRFNIFTGNFDLVNPAVVDGFIPQFDEDPDNPTPQTAWILRTVGNSTIIQEVGSPLGLLVAITVPVESEYTRTGRILPEGSPLGLLVSITSPEELEFDNSIITGGSPLGILLAITESHTETEILTQDTFQLSYRTRATTTTTITRLIGSPFGLLAAITNASTSRFNIYTGTRIVRVSLS